MNSNALLEEVDYSPHFKLLFVRRRKTSSLSNVGASSRLIKP